MILYASFISNTPPFLWLGGDGLTKQANSLYQRNQT